MSLQILIWHKISHQEREEDISHKEIFKANSMLDHPVEWPEALKKPSQAPGAFYPIASCWLCYPALCLVIAQVTQNCAAWMWLLRTSQNIYRSSFKLRLHCNPTSKDSFLINPSRTPGQKIKFLEKLNSPKLTLDTDLYEYAPTYYQIVWDFIAIKIYSDKQFCT